jgi:hypothetical protein
VLLLLLLLPLFTLFLLRWAPFLLYFTFQSLHAAT